ncbi:MAG: hypothetical protein KFF72_05235 [Arthrospira sp. SH-MAG29]|nr:hypothetical protein [Arthrospira sp. SH-MAG29]MBS0015759.1 hypothetical protein [Arthrospira sp. SH-MAG29]
MMQTDREFLTPEEAVKVDAALLSSKEKFATRLAIYALRCLREISQQQQCAIASITPDQITQWIEQDTNLHDKLEIDGSFTSFFSRLVMSSMKPLNRISEELQIPVANLTVDQVVAGFEKDSQVKR